MFSWQTTFRNETLSLVNGFHTTAEASEQEEEERDVSGRHEREWDGQTLAVQWQVEKEQ